MRTVGILAEFVTGVFLGELVSALQQAAHARGVRLLALRTGDVRSIYDQPLSLDCAQGWLVLLDAIDPAMVERIVARGLPLCALGYQYAHPATGFVRCDNRAGAFEALDALYRAGHREFAFVGHAHEPDVAEREEAMREFLAQRGLDTSPARFQRSDFYSYSGGREGAAKLLSSGIPFTALFAGNDQNALGAMARLAEHGLRVPEDVAVIGFDNSAYARAPANQIASIDQHLAEMAAAALDDVLARMDEPSRPPIRLRYPPSLVPRRSAGMAALPDATPPEMIRRDVALSSLANSDELNRLHHTGDLDSITPLLARMVPRLRFALVAEADEAGNLQVRFAAPAAAEFLLQGRGPIPPDRFPPMDLKVGPAAHAGDLIAVIPTDPRGGDRSVIAISAAAENFDAFELALLMHEVEVVAIGVERMFSRQRLERQVASRTRELREANAALATALSSLQQTQKELFQAEKMAAMGRLVASVAHELNTPLGNCLMSASTIETELASVRTALARGSIRRSELDHFVGAVTEGCSLLQQGLASTTQLLTNFRKASLPQASALRLHFDFRQLLRQITATLRQRYAGTPVEFLPVADETAPDPLMLNGFPDALSDVLYELAQNAVEHGLASRTGHVWLAWQLAGETLMIRVEDNGCGVPDDALDRIFDPFYNSRMGRSLGLGLSAVHNTVGGLLGGKISAEARPGGGTVMRIALPLTAPD